MLCAYPQKCTARLGRVTAFLASVVLYLITSHLDAKRAYVRRYVRHSFPEHRVTMLVSILDIGLGHSH